MSNTVFIPRNDGDNSNKSSAYIIHTKKALFTKQPLPDFRYKSIISCAHKLNRIGDRDRSW